MKTVFVSESVIQYKRAAYSIHSVIKQRVLYHGSGTACAVRGAA